MVLCFMGWAGQPNKKTRRKKTKSIQLIVIYYWEHPTSFAVFWFYVCNFHVFFSLSNSSTSTKLEPFSCNGPSMVGLLLLLHTWKCLYIGADIDGCFQRSQNKAVVISIKWLAFFFWVNQFVYIICSALKSIIPMAKL